MASIRTPDTVTVDLTREELETIRTGLRHTITFGTTSEEDRARDLLSDLGVVE